MRKDINKQDPTANLPTVLCEWCAEHGVETEVLKDYAFSYVIFMATTGHAYVGGFMCDTEGGQHWGCTPEHALEAAIVCAREHVHPTLLAKHEEQNAKGQTKASDEHKQLEAEGGSDFHIVRRSEGSQDATGGH